MRKRQAKKILRMPIHRQATYLRARRARYPNPDLTTAAFLAVARVGALGVKPMRELREAFKGLRG